MYNVSLGCKKEIVLVHWLQKELWKSEQYNKDTSIIVLDGENGSAVDSFFECCIDDTLILRPIIWNIL